MPAQRELHRVQGRLVPVQHDQLGRPEPVQLAAELGADGSPGAGYQQSLARDALAHRGHVGGHHAAPEQVADPRITDAVDLRAAGEQLPDRRDHLRHEPAVLGRLCEVADDLPAPAGDGDDQHPRAGLGGGLGHLPPAAEHRDTADPQPPLARVVVEDGNRPVGRGGRHGQPVDQLGARLPGTENDDLHRGGGRRHRSEPHGERRVPGAEHRRHGQQRAAQDLLRPGGQAAHQDRPGGQQAAGGQRDRLADRDDLVLGCRAGNGRGTARRPGRSRPRSRRSRSPRTRDPSRSSGARPGRSAPSPPPASRTSTPPRRIRPRRWSAAICSGSAPVAAAPGRPAPPRSRGPRPYEPRRRRAPLSSPQSPEVLLYVGKT